MIKNFHDKMLSSNNKKSYTQNKPVGSGDRNAGQGLHCFWNIRSGAQGLSAANLLLTRPPCPTRNDGLFVNHNQNVTWKVPIIQSPMTC